MQNAVFKALSHPARRQILALLRKGPQLAGDLAAEFDTSWPTMSRHLAVLMDAELVTADRQGNQILYRALMQSLCPDTTSRNNSGGEPSDIPALTHEQLVAFHARHYHSFQLIS